MLQEGNSSAAISRFGFNSFVGWNGWWFHAFRVGHTQFQIQGLHRYFSLQVLEVILRKKSGSRFRALLVDGLTEHIINEQR